MTNPKAVPSALTDDVVANDDVEVSPRGRRKILDLSLVAILRKVTPTHGVALGSTFGEVDKEDRPAVSASLRKHFGEAHPGKVARIDFTKAGVPQVRMRKS